MARELLEVTQRLPNTGLTSDVHSATKQKQQTGGPALNTSYIKSQPVLWNLKVCAVRPLGWPAFNFHSR